MKDGKVDAIAAFDEFKKNSWDVQWVTRYGQYQRSHYHGTSHEAMIVISGPGRIRWGAADLSEDWKEHTYGTAHEGGALEIEANTGDVFVIPAGVAHKSYDPSATEESFGYLDGAGQGTKGDQLRTALVEVPPLGFTMMGAYPRGFSWTWQEGGDNDGNFQKVWDIPNPALDPVKGEKGGVHEHWNQSGLTSGL